MDLEKSLITAASGMRSQGTRMRVISENIANKNTAPLTPESDPYRRKIVSFREVVDKETGAKTVVVSKVNKDKTDFQSRYDPAHPAADAGGYVKLPNVDINVEMADMFEAQGSFQSNLIAAESSRKMLMQTLDLLR